CLLQRTVTRRMKWLAAVAVFVMLMEWVDLYWIISPAFFPHGPVLSWMDLTLFIGVGGVWVSWFVWQLKGRPLLPLHDPRFKNEVIAVAH
ncbi:MAG TPA: hypothetical protein VL523_03185, partial [Terriglobia bacterium]|nr:hypothetical protein [Terriglobia bacterium]